MRHWCRFRIFARKHPSICVAPTSMLLHSAVAHVIFVPTLEFVIAATVAVSLFVHDFAGWNKRKCSVNDIGNLRLHDIFQDFTLVSIRRRFIVFS
ncbi:hypothetical protein EDD21DRAFT_366415 [Dissophora ornata]|nr:hypothetical protein EDD21DRAFT_366415 [Dissophora ornata]